MFEHSVKVPRLYKTAANIAKCVKEEGASIKGLVYQLKQQQNIKGVYALVVETLQRSNQIDFLLKKSQILTKETRFDPWLARVLITELLWGKKRLTSESKPIKTILAYQQILLAHSNEVFSAVVKPKVYKPRFVRINTLKLTINDAVNGFRNEDWTFVRNVDPNDYDGFLSQVSSLTEEQFMVDLHIKDLLVFPHNAQFYNHEAYLNGSIILQDKASCLPVHILNPEPGSVVLDMCAAPGMKTTQIAALMQNNGIIYAVERDFKRAQMLDKILENAGATCVKTINKDVLSLTGDDIKNVQYIIVDPSCSGSGMVDRVDLGNECSPSRLEKLAGFQIKILKHALRSFPDAARVVYSTCSVYPQENEEVVKEVISSTPNYKLVSAKHYLSSPWSPSTVEDDISCHCIHAKPEQDLTNGFFIAVFEKVENGEENVYLRDDLKKRSKIDTSTNTSTPKLKSKTNSLETGDTCAVCERKKIKSCRSCNEMPVSNKTCINDAFCEDPCFQKKKKNSAKLCEAEVTADKEQQKTKKKCLELCENEITEKLNEFQKILRDTHSSDLSETKCNANDETVKRSKKDRKKRKSNYDEPELEVRKKSSKKTITLEEPELSEELKTGPKKLEVFCEDIRLPGNVEYDKCVCKEDIGPNVICKSRKFTVDDETQDNEGVIVMADPYGTCDCVKNGKEKKKKKKKSSDNLNTEDVEVTNIDYTNFEEKAVSQPDITEKLSAKMRNEKHSHRDFKQRCHELGSEECDDYEVCLCKKCRKRKTFRETETTIFINSKDESIFGKIKDKVYTQQKLKTSSGKAEGKTSKVSKSKKSMDRKLEPVNEIDENTRKKSSLKQSNDNVEIEPEYDDEGSGTISNENQRDSILKRPKRKSENPTVYEVHYQCGSEEYSEQCPTR